MEIRVNRRLSLMDYEHVDVSVSQTFPDDYDYNKGLKIVESYVDKALLGQLMDKAFLVTNDVVKFDYLRALISFYSTPAEQRRKEQ